MTFKHGFTAEWAIVRELLDLEARGATFQLEPAGRFRVVPPSVLTADDKVFLSEHRDTVRQVLEYVERVASEPVS